MKLAHKLIGSFIAVSIVGAIVSAIGVRSLSQINERDQFLYEKELIGVSSLKQSTIEMLYIGRSTRNILLSPTEERRTINVNRIEKNLEALKAELDKVGSTIHTKEGKERLNKVNGLLPQYLAVVDQMLSIAKKEGLGNNKESVEFLFGPFSKIVNEMDQAMQDLVALKATNAKKFVDANNDTFENARVLLISLTFGSLLLGVGLGLLITRSLVKQLGGEPDAAAEIAQKVAAGDLSTPIQVKPGDTVSIMAAMNQMQHNLMQVISNVRMNAEGVATASTQIAIGNTDLSQRTEEQASALQQTAATMDQFGTTVSTNADNAKMANQLAANAAQIANQGGEAMGQVVDTMKGIDASSKRIAEIIGVIDGIAFQTNILALNAAVEAARAGEQGRGFAVVASEVRSLAGRSAEAAKEIKSLIGDSVAQVEQGTQLVDRAGQTMQEVVLAIKQVSDVVGDISAASVEQNTGVSQIGQAVNQLDQTTQQNAALVEESAAAAQALDQQARELVAAVSVFKLAAAHPATDHLLSAASPTRATPPKMTVVANNPGRASAGALGSGTRNQPALSQVPPEFKRNGTDDNWESF
ncbi:methyl-accepting chemotaxis protein [Curvibacter sp. HBC61]|uniref:Methyl-accepting chemotaxis protein n=1 Tax=Curvibacter cyanobacteriorum TaxID=3026422 RepID=A0ABT5MXH3_9BURK|nr:methyl-accepting chemotaxis protein [Curvibacter sp. HBC61]MDD0838758.1 methyl-accepting chemotaxis protein [Curvibacter sp. HBC61]